MARMILAAFAALCALAAVSGQSILGGAPQLQLPGLDLPELCDQLLGADLDVLGSLSNDTLQASQQALQAVLDQIQETTDSAEAAMQNAQQAVEDDVRQLTDELSARVQEWVEKANQALVNVSDCVNSEKFDLTEVTDNIAHECLAQSELFRSVKNLASVVPRARNILKDGAIGYLTCEQKTNTIAKRMCEATTIVPIPVKTALLVRDAISYTTQTITARATFVSSVANCSAKAVAAARNNGIVNDAISCIQGKLNPAS